MPIRSATAALMFVAASSVAALESGRYNVRMFSNDCALLATGVFNLQIDTANAEGRQRVTGNRVFVPLAERPYRFFWLPRELEGRVEDAHVQLNLDRNTFDSNVHIAARVVNAPEPGLAGTWLHTGWGIGPGGAFVAARAPAEPSTPCEGLPQPRLDFPLVVPGRALPNEAAEDGTGDH